MKQIHQEMQTGENLDLLIQLIMLGWFEIEYGVPPTFLVLILILMLVASLQWISQQRCARPTIKGNAYSPLS